MADGSDRRQLSDIQSRLQNLRSLLNSERHLPEQDRAIEALDREMDQMSADYAALREGRRRDYETHTQDYDTSSVSDYLPRASTPPTFVRARRRAVRPSERLQRVQRERLGQSARIPISDTQNPPTHQSPYSPTHSTSDRGERLRPKRRKLDDGSYDEEPSKTFSYGFDGQVIPGQLRLEIVSCDGGEYSDPQVPINNYPHHVLKDDSTVYCTKSNQCNMLLKHEGGMPFTLTKIIVKAPRTGFDAPIQEGLIFIAMDDEGIIDKTSQYDIRWSPRNYVRSRYRAEPQRPSREYMNSTRSPLRSIDRSRYLSNPTGQDDNSDTGPSLVPGFNVSVADPSDEEETGEGPLSPRPWHDDEYSPHPYLDRYRPVYLGMERNENPSATSSDSEAEADFTPDERPSGERERVQREYVEIERARRNQMLDHTRAQQIRESDELFGRRTRQADHDDDDHWQFDNTRQLTPSRGAGRTFAPAIGAPDPAYPSERRASRTLDPEECNSSKTTRSETRPSSSGESHSIYPHARFFISRSKSSTAIKFDPPVSGRYILVKLWAQCPKANIDIQAILAQGYGGPRFFPCVELR